MPNYRYLIVGGGMYLITATAVNGPWLPFVGRRCAGCDLGPLGGDSRVARPEDPALDRMNLPYYQPIRRYRDQDELRRYREKSSSVKTQSMAARMISPPTVF